MNNKNEKCEFEIEKGEGWGVIRCEVSDSEAKPNGADLVAGNRICMRKEGCWKFKAAEKKFVWPTEVRSHSC